MAAKAGCSKDEGRRSDRIGREGPERAEGQTGGGTPELRGGQHEARRRRGQARLPAKRRSRRHDAGRETRRLTRETGGCTQGSRSCHTHGVCFGEVCERLGSQLRGLDLRLLGALQETVREVEQLRQSLDTDKRIQGAPIYLLARAIRRFNTRPPAVMARRARSRRVGGAASVRPQPSRMYRLYRVTDGGRELTGGGTPGFFRR